MAHIVAFARFGQLELASLGTLRVRQVRIKVEVRIFKILEERRRLDDSKQVQLVMVRACAQKTQLNILINTHYLSMVRYNNTTRTKGQLRL